MFTKVKFDTQPLGCTESVNPVDTLRFGLNTTGGDFTLTYYNKLGNPLQLVTAPTAVSVIPGAVPINGIVPIGNFQNQQEAGVLDTSLTMHFGDVVVKDRLTGEPTSIPNDTIFLRSGCLVDVDFNQYIGLQNDQYGVCRYDLPFSVATGGRTGPLTPIENIPPGVVSSGGLLPGGDIEFFASNGISVVATNYGPGLAYCDDKTSFHYAEDQVDRPGEITTGFVTGLTVCYNSLSDSNYFLAVFRSGAIYTSGNGVVWDYIGSALGATPGDEGGSIAKINGTAFVYTTLSAQATSVVNGAITAVTPISGTNYSPTGITGISENFNGGNFAACSSYTKFVVDTERLAIATTADGINWTEHVEESLVIPPDYGNSKVVFHPSNNRMCFSGNYIEDEAWGIRGVSALSPQTTTTLQRITDDKLNPIEKRIGVYSNISKVAVNNIVQGSVAGGLAFIDSATLMKISVTGCGVLLINNGAQRAPFTLNLGGGEVTKYLGDYSFIGKRLLVLKTPQSGIRTNLTDWVLESYLLSDPQVKSFFGLKDEITPITAGASVIPYYIRIK